MSEFELCGVIGPTTGHKCTNLKVRGRVACRVHLPERQCGFIKPDGSRCIVATGGKGYCHRHRDESVTQ